MTDSDRNHAGDASACVPIMAVVIVWAAAIALWVPLWVTLAIVQTWRVGMLAIVLTATIPGAGRHQRL